MQNKNTPWQSYWKDTSFDTFGARFSDENPIAGVLAKEISSINFLNSTPQSLLDLGCGRGEHFRWLRHVFPSLEGKTLKITGVDAAVPDTKIDANTQIYTDNFESLINTRRSQEAFDIVFALFAAEYGNGRKLVRALNNVAKKSMDCLFLMHTPDSVISAKSKISLNFYELLLDKATTTALRILKKSHDIKAFEMYVLGKINSIVNLNRPELMEDMQLVVQRLQQLFSAVDLRKKVAHAHALIEYFEQLKMHVLRLEQQLKAAKNSDSLVDELVKQNYEIKVDKCLQNQFGEVGRLLHFVLVPRI
ncbi:class I SAM-dependent methyltransferase [Planctobacterium marinum]|uniref:Methyltransferase domain-containing protein n=1 Tax=Planctobacterium marinum TaxID=1631968 RepID=A0AA48KRS6_9ALTE|nr:hypothetical protein MACH26_12550 [Planctobacterium marinum]